MPSQSRMPHLTQARAPLTHEVRVVNQFGEVMALAIPAERALTVYVDKRELVTLMTLEEKVMLRDGSGLPTIARYSYASVMPNTTAKRANKPSTTRWLPDP